VKNQVVKIQTNIDSEHMPTTSFRDTSLALATTMRGSLYKGGVIPPDLYKDGLMPFDFRIISTKITYITPP
jgi:hypothetical protein